MARDIQLVERAEKLLAANIRVFHHPDYDDKKKQKEILRDIPNLTDFNALRKKVEHLRQSNLSPEMRPCYEEPLLTREQEYHLFKQMNYFKYRAKSLKIGLNTNRLLSRTRIEQIESFLEKAALIRNQIANSNFRLATQILKKDINHFHDAALTETFLSDAYLDVLKAVDYFDYNLGNKFSTYCTWVIKKNFFRSVKTHQKNADIYNSNSMDDKIDICDNNNDPCQLETEETKGFVHNLIQKASKNCNVRDAKRQVYILEYYFGLNGKEKHTLEQISEKLGITKERVRQLKEKFLNSMRETAVGCGYEAE